MTCHPTIMKTCALAFMFSAVVLPHSAPGQDFNLAFETRANGTITGLEAFNTPEGDLIVATSDRHIYWFDPATSTWSEQQLPYNVNPEEIQQVGDSTIVVAAKKAGLYILSSDRSVFTAEFVEPHWQWHSFAVAESGRWISAGDIGVSWSDDAGASWSPIDTLFVDACCTGPALVRSLRGGVTVAWALTGTFERNFPRLHYSTDEGTTWSDSAAIVRPASEIHAFLSTSQHVEIQIVGRTHLARKTWTDPLVGFAAEFNAEDATSSPMWGVIAASFDGLFILNESSLSWSPFGSQMAIREVAASESGRIYVAEAGSNSIWRLDPIATNRESPEDALPQELVVYPNPSSDIIYLAGSRHSSQYMLYDILGRVVRKLKGADLVRGTNISGLAPGTYYLTEYSARTGSISTPAFFTKTGR